MLLGSNRQRRPRYSLDDQLSAFRDSRDAAPIDAIGGAQLPDTTPDEFHRGVDLGQMSQAPVADFQKKPSIFERLRNPTASGVLLRNGMAMLTGGNPMAGFDWQEKRRAEAEGNRRWDMGFGLQQREADRGDFTANAQAGHWQQGDNTDAYNAVTGRQTGLGQIRNAANRNAIEERGNVRDNSTRLTAAEIAARTSMYGSDKDFAGRVYSSDSSAAASRYGTDGEVFSAMNKPAAGIGTNSYKVRTKTAAQPGANHWFVPDEPAQPETVVEQQFPVPPSSAIVAAKKNPNLRGDFEQMFGPGSWGRFVGQ